MIAIRQICGGLIVCGLALMPAVARADWVSVISKNRLASVLLKIEDGSGKPGFGSGTIIDADGHVLTARHLLSTAEARSRESFEVSGLVGWTDPSIDFSKATDLAIDYISQANDLAILHFRSPSPAIQAASAKITDVPDGTGIIVIGYPGGGNLTSTTGIAAGAAGSGEIRTDARVEKGDSGCGVFDDVGNLVGMLVQGLVNKSGDVQLGYFLTTTTIASDIASNRPPFVLQSGAAVPAAPLVRLSVLRLSYPLDETKSDHQGLNPTRQSYRRSYHAQYGYKITSADFHTSSANHVWSNPHLVIAPDGANAVIDFGLESGPIFDQWRGWLSGNVILQEAAR